MRGRGILNLHEFNKALLGKWWWKIYFDQNGCWSKIIHYNCLNKEPIGLMFHLPPWNKSYFWAGITPIFPSFKLCTSKIVKNRDSTLLWYDNWLQGRAPKNLCPYLFNDCNFTGITIKQFTQDLSSSENFFRTSNHLESLLFLSSIPHCSRNYVDLKIWRMAKPFLFDPFTNF